MAKRKLKKKSVLRLFIVVGVMLVLAVIGFFTYDYAMKEINGEAKYLLLNLVGNKEITIKFTEEYTDPGATSSYKDDDLTDKIEVDTNLDLEHVGTYKYTYKIKYKNQEKKIERIVKVIDEDYPSIELKGSSTITIAEGNQYNDLGAIASDNYDGDLTEKIVVDTSNVDMNTIGTYKVVYKVTDSSGNTSETERVVNVVKKGADNQKVAVLNYHFFYETWDENCHESICLKMDKFREQLKYLKDNGYYTLTIDEFVKWMYGEINIPEKSVLITIDDGAHGTSKINGNHLIPALEEYQMHATLFLITGWWDIENYRSEYLDVQSHTNDLHYESKCGYRSRVNCVSYNDLLNDLKKSIDVVKDTSSFCFPFYEYTSSSIKAVKESGFKVAFIGGYRKASRSDDKYKIPRYPIYDSTSLSEFKIMVG